MRVKLDDLILVATEIRYYAEYDTDHYQKTALWTQVF